MKNQRAFWMTVQGATQKWTFTSPLTLEMNVTRGAFNGLADGVFRIYNLSESTRSDIYQDWYDQGEYRQIIVRAGYKSWSQIGPVEPSALLSGDTKTNIFQALPIIFQGNIRKAYSQREGSSWVTTINAWDGGFAATRADANVPLASGISLFQQFTTLINLMPKVKIGFIDESLKTENATGVSFVGNPWEKITQLATAADAQALIDLEKVYIFKRHNFVNANILSTLDTISPDTGLTDTPLKQNTQISFNMIFEPRLTVGQLVNLQSLETVNNGKYPVVGLDHVGTISDAVGGDMQTRVYCYYEQGITSNGIIP